MKKLMYITAATLLVAGLATAPAFAQGTAKKTMPMKKAHHTMSCYDYAWDSQAQKDCLAGKKPMMKKTSAKKSMKMKKMDMPKKS